MISEAVALARKERCDGDASLLVSAPPDVLPGSASLIPPPEVCDRQGVFSAWRSPSQDVFHLKPPSILPATSSLPSSVPSPLPLLRVCREAEFPLHHVHEQPCQCIELSEITRAGSPRPVVMHRQHAGPTA